MQATWRVYLTSALLACVVAAATALVVVRLLVPPAGQSSNVMTLEGVAEVPWGVELEVFYKAPFAAPPYLTFPEGLEHNCKVVDQKATSFKLRRSPGGQASSQYPNVKWKAEGQPAK